MKKITVLTVEQLRRLTGALLKAAGANQEDTEIITESLVWATLRGHDTHGMGHLSLYLRMYRGPDVTGLINKEGSWRVLREGPSTVLIDANHRAGQTVTLRATEMVIEKAKKMGVAAAATFNGMHNGALGFYMNRVVEQGLIGIALSCSGAACAPYGGTERLLGTNPISVGIPAGREKPIIIDMATSATTWLNILPRLASGEPIPEGVILDDEGDYTTDPAKFAAGHGGTEPHGSIASMAKNHKGYAIQLAIEVLGGILPGLVTANDILGQDAGPAKFSIPCFVAAIDIAAFQDPEVFRARVDERIRRIRSSRRKPGIDRIYLPGERGFLTEEKRLKDGVPIGGAQWEEIRKMAEELGVDVRAV